MKIETIYICDICQTNYSTAHDACDCEQSHRDENNFKIKSCRYDLKDKRGSELAMNQKVPKFITIQFSEENLFDFGIYELKQYGPKGL